VKYYPHEDIELLKKKIIQKVKAEVQVRMFHGYKNINVDLIEPLVEEALRELSVI
jgi:hypothetical protein